MSPGAPDYRDCRAEHELAALSDEALTDYIVAEREAGRPECVKRAVAIFAFGYEPTIRFRVADKVPPEDVEDVAGTVLESVVHSAFDGRSVGQLKTWLKVITQRRIADYWDKKGRTPETAPLPGGGDEEGGVWGTEPSNEDETAVIAIREAAGRLIERLNPLHEHVVRLYGPNGLGYLSLSAAETAASVAKAHGETISEANVHKIWSRFKTDLENELGVGGS